MTPGAVQWNSLGFVKIVKKIILIESLFGKKSGLAVISGIGENIFLYNKLTSVNIEVYARETIFSLWRR